MNDFFLCLQKSDKEIEIGAGVTLSELIIFLKKSYPESYAFAAVVQHLEKVCLFLKTPEKGLSNVKICRSN